MLNESRCAYIYAARAPIHSCLPWRQRAPAIILSGEQSTSDFCPKPQVCIRIHSPFRTFIRHQTPLCSTYPCFPLPTYPNLQHYRSCPAFPTPVVLRFPSKGGASSLPATPFLLLSTDPSIAFQEASQSFSPLPHGASGNHLFIKKKGITKIIWVCLELCNTQYIVSENRNIKGLLSPVHSIHGTIDFHLTTPFEKYLKSLNLSEAKIRAV